MKPSQTSQILAALKRGETLTPIDALERFGCFRLGARCHDLRTGKFDGKEYNIINEPRKGENFARYRLIEEVEQGVLL